MKQEVELFVLGVKNTVYLLIICSMKVFVQSVS